MKMDMLNIDEFVKVNDLKAITNPVSLDSTMLPTPDGIFSYDVFGYSELERKNTFAYIDLNGWFMFPQVAKTLHRLGALGKILDGSKYAIVILGKIKTFNRDEAKDHPEAETGLQFYWDYWDKINWLKTSSKDASDSGDNVNLGKDDSDDNDGSENAFEMSIDKKNRIDYLASLKRESDAFVDKWLVLPPFYRDFSTDDSSLGDDINKLYNELISRTRALKSGFGLSMFNDVAKNRVQNILASLYDMTMGPVSGKTVDVDTGQLMGNSKRSLIKKNLIGRSVDYAAYSVITSPNASSTDSVDDYIKPGEAMIPLMSTISMLHPFFEKYVSDFLETESEYIKAAQRDNVKYIDSSQWSKDGVDKIIDRFMKTGAEKDEPVLLEFTDKNGNTIEQFSYINEYSRNSKDSLTVSRPMTWLDLLYIAAEDITKDKYQLITRYPVADIQNIYPSKMTVSSTNKTRSVYISIPNNPDFNDLVYFKKYPYINLEKLGVKDPDPKPASYYDLYRVTIIGNSPLASMGADYDKTVLENRT